MTNKLGNPGIFGLITFGFALSLLGFQMAVSPTTAGATLFAVLVAALGETLAGLWCIARGDGYMAGILCSFGLWLVGYYFFLTTGMAAHLFTPEANGLYVLMLVIPVAMLAIPAFRRRQTILSAAFVSIIAMLVTLGLGSYFSNSALGTVAGWLAFLSAALIWYLAYEMIEVETRPAAAASR